VLDVHHVDRVGDACLGAGLRLHQATLDSQDVPWGIVERLSATATATVAGVQVRRDYAL
jgi:hypothetical protein